MAHRGTFWHSLALLDIKSHCMTSHIKLIRICQFCEKEFVARTTVTKTCSDNCAKRLYKRKQREGKIIKSIDETQALRNKPINEVQCKEFLSILEACLLLGVSRRTIYRMIAGNSLKIGKAGNRTVIKRSEIEKIFE